MDITQINLDDKQFVMEYIEHLTDEIQRMRQEVAGSQLIAALMIKQHGNLIVSRDTIAEGLPGYHIAISEAGGDIMFSLEEPNDDE